MPRYHFNVFDGNSRRGGSGMDVLDLRAALQVGIALSGNVLSQNAGRMCLSHDWRMEITDDAGLLMFRLDFTMTGSAAASVIMKGS